MSADLVHEKECVAFLRTDRLGETILNLPTVAALKAARPAARVIFICHPDLLPLIERVPEVDRAISYPGERPGWWMARAVRLALLMRREGCKVALVSNPMKELHLAAWLAGIPKRIGYDHKWAGCLTHRIPDRKALGDRHEVEYNLDLVSALGTPASLPSWHFPPFKREQADVLQRLERHGVSGPKELVLIHPWTSNPVKRWPVERFRVLVDAVRAKQLGVPVVIGGAQERNQGQPVFGAGTVDLTGELSVTELVALCQHARILVSNDSGPVHVAAASGLPTVVLFGGGAAATGPKRWGPWGGSHRVIHRPSLSDIEAAEVVAAVEQQLQRTKERARREK